MATLPFSSSLPSAILREQTVLTAGPLRCSLAATKKGFALVSQPHNSERSRVRAPRAADVGVDLLVAEEASLAKEATSLPDHGLPDSKSKQSRGGNIHLDPKDIILVQGFNWGSPHSSRGWYNVVMEMVEDLAQIGVTDVWLPPPSKAVDKNGYLPTQLYNLDASSFGGEQNLKELLDLLHSKGMRAHADIVINHRCGDFQDSDGNWTIFEGGTPDDRLDWGPWAIAAGDQPYGGQGQPDTGDDYGAAPDIDHTNPRVQEELTKWLLWLKEEIGFDGWRFDFVKGYAGHYTALYCERTKPVFAVGELWTNMSYENGGLASNQNQHRQELIDWVDSAKGECTAFDFTTKGVLQEACRNTEYWRLRDDNGKPAGMLGHWPAKAVTFIDNHDTGSSQNHWPFPSDKVMQGYAYILTHPGVPCIFWDHIFDWGHKEKIAELISVRKRNGLHAESPIEILTANADLYLAKVSDRVIVKLGPSMDLGGLAPKEDEFQIAAFGDGYAVWEKK